MGSNDIYICTDTPAAQHGLNVDINSGCEWKTVLVKILFHHWESPHCTSPLKCPPGMPGMGGMGGMGGMPGMPGMPGRKLVVPPVHILPRGFFQEFW